MQERKITLIDIGAGALPSVTPVTAQNSSWFPTVYVSPETPPVDGVTPEPVADGVLIEWDAIDQAGVVYIIERGPSQNGPWTEIHRTTETRYLYSDGSGQKWYFRITASVRGKPGQGTVVEATPAPTTAQLVTAQQKLDKEIVDRALADANEAAARARDIGSVNASLVLEAQTRVTQIGQAMDAIAAEGQTRATDLLNEKLEREAAITAVSETQQNGFDSLSRALSEVAAGSGTQFDSKRIWDFNLTTESWTGNGAPALVDGWLRPANAAANPYVQSPGGLAIDGSGYRFVKMRIKKVGNPTWAGALQWTTTTDATWNTTKRVTMAEPAWDSAGVATLDVADIAWRPSTIAAVRLQLGAAQGVSDYYLIDWLAIGRPMPAASVALVQEETQARVTALASEATQRNTLAVQMRGNYTGTDLSQAQGLMGDERTARAAADSSQVQRITTMEARMPAGSGGLATSASVTTLQDAMVAADQANAQATTKVSSDLRAAMGRGVNLVINGDLMNDLAGWAVTGAPSSWSISNEGRNGGKCLRGAIVAPPGVASSAQANLNEGIEVKVGRRYRLRAWVKVSGNYVGDTASSKIRVGAVRTDGVELLLWSQWYIAAWTDWRLVEQTFTIGADILRFRISAGIYNSAGYVLVDDFEFVDITDEEQIASNASGLSSITTRVGVVEGTLVTQGTALTQVQADVAGKASNAALTSLDSKVTQLGSTVTSQGTALTNVTASLQSIGGDNLLANSGFEQNGAGWTSNSISPGTATISRTFVDSALPGSSKAARWEIANLIPGSSYEYVSNSSIKTMKVEPGKQHTISVYVRGNYGARVFMQFQWRNAAGAIITYSGTPAAADRVTTPEWARHQWTATAPVAAATCNLYLRVYGADAPDQWVEWDNVQVQVGAVATGYAPSLDEIASASAANAAATSTLTGKVTALEGTTTAQGQAITTVNAQLAATQQAGPNIMIDGGFEAYAADALIYQAGTGTLRAIAGAAGSRAYVGARAARLLRTGAPSNNNTDTYFGPEILTNEGRVYLVEAWLKNDPDAVAPGGSTYSMGLTGINSAGVRAWYSAPTTSSQRMDALANWTKISGYVTISNPTVKAQLWATIQGRNGQTPQNVALLIDNVMWQDVTDAYGAKTTADAAATGLSALTATVTQQGGQISAQSTQLNQVQAEVAGKADASAYLQLEAKVDANLSGAGNMLAATTFADAVPGLTTPGWAFEANTSNSQYVSGYVQTDIDAGVPTGMRALILTKSGTANGNGHVIWRNTASIPVTPKKTYIASVYASGYSGVPFLWVTGAGMEVVSPPSKAGGGNTLAGYDRIFVKFTPPAGCRAVGFRLALAPAAGNGTDFGRFVRPMLEEVQPGQDAPSPWSAGGQESFASVGLFTDVNGNIAGIQNKNNGTTSEINMLANVLNILSPGAADGLEIQKGYLRVWRGNSQRIIGNGFGVSGEGLIDYFGPNVGAAAASKANATVWMDVNGNAYWGGALAAGIRRNAAQSTSIVTIGNFVTVGPFDTNGRNKQVVISYSRTVRATKYAMGPDGFRPGGGANSATVNVYRRIGAAGEVLWGQVQAGGNLEIHNEPDSADVLLSRWAGSLTLNDSADGTAQRTYRAEIVAFSSQSYTHDSGNWDASTTSQSLSIVSIED